jgi:hypothetical protein
MKQLHLTGKIACALILTTAALAGCKDKDPVSPPSPTVDTPAVTPPAATPTPAPEGGNMTPPAGTTPTPDAPAPAPAPTTEPPPPTR